MIMPFYDYGERKITTTIEEYMITQHWGELENKSIDELIQIAQKDVFNFKYPFYSENPEDKDSFERTFILNNYNRCIAYETIGQFKLRLLAILTKKMPYYKSLYETTILNWNPLENKRYTIEKGINIDEKDEISENYTNNDNGKTSQSNSSNTESQEINSNNPQVNFAGIDYASTMNRGRNSQNNNNNTDVSNNSTGNRTGNTTRTGNNRELSNITGLDYGNPAELIGGYRDLIVNINELLLDNLQELFSCFD